MRKEKRSTDCGQKKGVSEAPKKNDRRDRAPHRRGSVILLRILIVLAAAVALAVVVRLLLLLVPIRSIVILDESYYTNEEILDAIGIEEGDRMFGFSSAKAEKRIRKECTLLSDARFDRAFNGTLTVSVKEKESDFYVNVSGTYCLLGREDLRVLVQSDTPDRFLEYGFYEISLPNVRVAFLGDKLEYGSEKENGYVSILLDALDASPLKDRITGIRAAERFHLSVIIDGKYDVTLGDVKDIQDKLDYFSVMEQSDKTEIFRSGGNAEIDLSVLSAPTVRAVDAIDQTISKE